MMVTATQLEQLKTILGDAAVELASVYGPAVASLVAEQAVAFGDLVRSGRREDAQRMIRKAMSDDGLVREAEFYASGLYRSAVRQADAKKAAEDLFWTAVRAAVTLAVTALVA